MLNFLLVNFFLRGPLTWALCTGFVAFACMLFLGTLFISFAQKNLRSVAREDTPETHRAKDFTPTMAGVCIVAAVVITLILVGIWTPYTSIFVGILCSFCGIGAWDDLNKIRFRKGISERKKFIAQVVVAAVLMTAWYLWTRPSTVIVIPGLLWLSFNLGAFFFIIWTVWVIACTVNAVNFTDGLDGLATLTLLPVYVTFGILALWLGYYDIVIIAAALVGALLGFLWYNAHPAQFFMGDAGSLALGAGLATIALMLKAELLIPIAGGIFVLEGVSVALQIIYFKLTQRRLFKMAPIHHHFELMGCPETKITARFFIATVMLCSCALGLFLMS